MAALQTASEALVQLSRRATQGQSRERATAVQILQITRRILRRNRRIPGIGTRRSIYASTPSLRPCERLTLSLGYCLLIRGIAGSQLRLVSQAISLAILIHTAA